MFGVMVEDVLTTSQAVLAEAAPQSVEDIRALDHAVIRFSPALWSDLKVIRVFLFTRMSRAPSVVTLRARVTRVVEDLFAHLFALFRLVATAANGDRGTCEAPRCGGRCRSWRGLVSDYIAGMTDRFALQEHARLDQAGAVPRGKQVRGF